MYTLQSSLCLPRSAGAQWAVVDLSKAMVYDIFNVYEKVYLTLKVPQLSDPIYVNFSNLAEEYANFGGTLTQLLIAIGDLTLPTVPSLPNASIKYARYSDSVQAGYKVDTTIIGINTPANYPPAEKKDLILTRPGFTAMDMTLVHDYCLLTVNGYLHRTDASQTAAYIYDGGTTMRHSRKNYVGIISFHDIGKITKIPITEDMIYTQAADSNLKERTYLWLNQDTTGKTVLLSIGGYLFMPQDQMFWQSGENTFALNWASYPLVERLIESRNYLDLSSLGLDYDPKNPSLANVTQMLSDAVLKKYMTLSQSFFILVDTDNLFSNRKFAQNTRTPGKLISYENPIDPLIIGYGKFAEYFKVQEDGLYAMNVEDSLYRNYLISTRSTQQLKNVNDSLNPERPFDFTTGFMLEIGSYK